MTRLAVDDFFKAGGLFSQVKPNFSPRAGQADLAELILASSNNKEHVLAEGPTGFGKSLAVLVPAVIRAIEDGKRVVISTETLALQDQYLNKDLPMLLQAVKLVGKEFTFAAAKGRNNYVCRNKQLADAMGSPKSVSRVNRWASTQSLPMHSGDIATIPGRLDPKAHEIRSIIADDDCEKRGCSFYGDGPNPAGHTECFVYQASKNQLLANIVVTNHTLLLLDRQHCTTDSPEGPLLGRIDLLIVDEGHTLPEKAQATWGYEFSPNTLSDLMRGINRMMVRVRVNAFDDDYLETWQSLEETVFKPLNKHLGKSVALTKLPPQDVEESKAVSELVLKAMKAQYVRLNKDSEGNLGAENAVEAAKDKLKTAFLALQSVYIGDGSANADDPAMHDNWLSFIETVDGANQKYLKLKVKPIEVGPLMHGRFFSTIKSVIITSATLRLQKSFKFIRKELGIPKETLEFIGETPFDFQSSVLGYFPLDLPFPPDRFSSSYRLDLAEYNRECAARIIQLIEHTGGGALVLFTSVESMKDLYELVKARTKVNCMCQGDAAKHILVHKMQEDIHSCLFATKSFFTGVDIPGQSLRLLILMRAPFRVPNDPMFAARCDNVKMRGGSDFKELSLPLMLMDLLQAFGRLIRTETDTGIFALLDSRANVKGYGKDIIAALPKVGKLKL